MLRPGPTIPLNTLCNLFGKLNMKKVNHKITLRKWNTSDAKELSLIGDNYKIFSQLRDGFPHPYTVKKAEEYIININKNSKAVFFAIEFEDKLVGNIGITFCDNVYRKNVELAYFLAEEYWGRKIITKAIRILCKFVFEEYPDINRIFAEPYGKNIASQKALENAGFKLEGILRENVTKNNHIDDTCVYSILRKEHKVNARSFN